MTDPRCPICWSQDCQEHYRDPDQANIRLHLCRNCGLAFLFPSLSPEETRRFNAESYDYGKAIFIPSVHQKYRQRVKRQADFITQHLPQGGRVLDIGCYQGDLLQELHERGWQGAAIESSGQACQFLKENRPHIAYHHGFVEDRPFRGEYFDLIISSRTLNHILNPVQFLADLVRYAHLQTRLYLEVSSLASVLSQPGVESGNYFKAYHPVVFTMLTLVNTFNRAGWGGFLHLDTITDSEEDTVYLRALSTLSIGAGKRAVQENREILEDYCQQVAACREKKRQQIESLRTEHRPFVTWGAGDLALRLLGEEALAENPNWLGWIDSHAAKWGSRLLHREILPPARLKDLNPDLIVITASPGFAEEIQNAAREQLPQAKEVEFVCIG